MRDDLKKNLLAQKHQVDRLEDGMTASAGAVEENDRDLADLCQRSARIREELRRQGHAIPDPVAPDLGATTEEDDEPRRRLSYQEVTASNMLFLEENGLLDADFDALFTPAQLRQIEQELCRPLDREPWDRWDFVAVFVAAIAGVVADFLCGAVNNQLAGWLGDLKPVDVHKNLSIDHMGPGFGGPYHRGLSSGHDLLRPIAALRQIQSGDFEGLRMISGGFEWVVAGTNSAGNPFATYQGLEAVLTWLKHLWSDFVTETSLPVPGMSFLVEMPNKDIRKFAIQMYRKGFNLRSLLTQALAPALVEVIIRGYVFGREFVETGKIAFPSAKSLKTTELLLASHGMVTAVNVGKVAVLCNAEGPVALRHLNIPSIIATVRYFVSFVIKSMQRRDPVEIIKRNAREIMEGYDERLAVFGAELIEDPDFENFLTDGKTITV